MCWLNYDLDFGHQDSGARNANLRAHDDRLLLFVGHNCGFQRLRDAYLEKGEYSEHVTEFASELVVTIFADHKLFGPQTGALQVLSVLGPLLLHSRGCKLMVPLRFLTRAQYTNRFNSS